MSTLCIDVYPRDRNVNRMRRILVNRHGFTEKQNHIGSYFTVEVPTKSAWQTTTMLKFHGFKYRSYNKRYARVLFVLAKKNKNYKENEKFVKNLNSRINKKVKNLSRGIMNRTDVIFNQDLSSHAILLEVGGVDNTIEEVNNTLEVIANVLKEYINEELNG